MAPRDFADWREILRRPLETQEVRQRLSERVTLIENIAGLHARDWNFDFMRQPRRWASRCFREDALLQGAAMPSRSGVCCAGWETGLVQVPLPSEGDSAWYKFRVPKKLNRWR